MSAGATSTVEHRLVKRGRRLAARLRPSSGHELPLRLRARHVGQIVEGLSLGVEDAAFERLLCRIDQSFFMEGNAVELFFDGGRVFEAMKAAIDAATSEVLLESYIVRDDRAGAAMGDSLAAAAARGADVRVLADGFGSFGTRRRFWDELRRRRVRVALYHPVPGRNLLRRDHRKILVVDRRVAFTGGMNVGEEYGFPGAVANTVWRDTQARVEGPTAWEMAVVFAEGWARASGEALVVAPLERAQAAGTRVLVLDSQPLRGRREVAAAFAAIVSAARRQLWITSAYFAPKPRLVDALGRAVARGVDVRLLLPGTTDVAVIRHAGHGSFDRLLRQGVRVFEYQPAVLHAKTMVADGQLVVVGSSNLDIRSFSMNAECNWVVPDARLAGIAERQFEEDLGSSVEISQSSWSRRSPMHRAADALARRLSTFL